MSSRNDRRRHNRRMREKHASKAPSQSEKLKETPRQPAQKEQLPEMPQTPAQSGRHRTFGEILANNPLIVLAGFVAAIAGLVWLKGSPLFLDPEIHAATDSFMAPFTVVNKSSWYSMTDIKMVCQQGLITYVNPNYHAGFNTSLRPAGPGYPILPDGHATMPCLGFEDLGPVVSGTMTLHIIYTTRWFSHIIRAPRAITVTETYEQGKWIDGDII